MWSVKHFIFTILSLKNSIIRERFYHLIFSWQFLVCNFLVGNSFFLGIIRKKVSFGLWKCSIFLCIERLILDYEESESLLLLNYGRKGNDTGSLSAAPSCKLFLWLCHVVQSEILASFTSTLPLDPYISVYNTMQFIAITLHNSNIQDETELPA